MNIQDSDNFYIDIILKSVQKPILISLFTNQTISQLSGTRSNCDQKEYFGEFHATVIIANIESLANQMKFHLYPSGIFLFIITTNDLDISLLEFKLRTIWIGKGSHNIYVLTKIGIWTLDPFQYDFKRDEFGKLVKYEFQNKTTAFYDMNGYPLRIELFKSVYSVPKYNKITNQVENFTGTDPMVVELLKQRMNFTLIHQKSSIEYFGYKLPNGSFNGAIGRILRGETDAVFTTFFIKDYGTYDIEYTVSVYSDKLCCYVPKAKRIPQSILPLLTLDYKMWMCYIFAPITCGGIWCILHYFSVKMENQRKHNKYKITLKRQQYLTIFTDIWIIWVRVGLRHFPRFPSEKVFVLYISLLSVIFGAIFDSSLATVYIKPLYYKDINSLNELDKSNLNIFYKYTSMKDDLFPSDSSSLFARLNTKLRFIESTKLPLIEIMSQKGNFAGVTRESALNLEAVKYFTSHKIHKISECPKTYTLAYVLPKHSVYSRRINALLLRFLSAGLIDKWIDEMYFNASLKEHHEENVGVSFKILSLNDLQLPFYALFLGYIISGLVLIVEIFKQRNVEKINRKYFKENFVNIQSKKKNTIT